MNTTNDSTLDIIGAVDNIDRSINLVKGMAHDFNTAIDIFPVPKDEPTLDYLNTFQLSAMALLEMVCSLLKTTSDGLMACARRMPKEQKHE